MNLERLEEIKAANAARTPGKWYWFGYLANKSFDLNAYAPNSGGVKTVMCFRRWGMHGAQPVFGNDASGSLIEAKENLIITDQTTCNPKIKGVDNPNGRFIEKAPEYVTELLALVEEQAAQIRELEGAVDHLQNWCAAPCECEMPPGQLVEIDVEGVPV